MQRGRNCKCGRDYDMDQEVSSKHCSIKCTDQDAFCGGEEAFSVYLGTDENYFIIIAISRSFHCFVYPNKM